MSDETRVLIKGDHPWDGYSGVAIGTDGALIENVANLSGLMISEADGDIDIDIEESGTATWYLVLVNPFGQLIISAAITF